ncbi:MAG: hypothetical protein ACR2FG_15390 [Marmoricola sp.]
MRRAVLAVAAVVTLAGCAGDPVPQARPIAETTTQSSTRAAPSDPVNEQACLQADAATTALDAQPTYPSPSSAVGRYNRDYEDRILDALGAMDQDEPDPNDVGIVATGEVSAAVEAAFQAVAHFSVTTSDESAYPGYYQDYSDALANLAAACSAIGYDGF